MSKTRAEIIADLKLELAEYVKFRQRRGQPITFQQALRAHRMVIEQGVRDCPNDDGLRERLSYLDDLMVQEGLAP